jgi:hypothetical protein
LIDKIAKQGGTMRKRIIAFYDVLLFAIICAPMIIAASILLFMLVTKGTSEWIY